MIWFSGILQNTCCNKINENKTKKPLNCVWCLLHNFAHSLTLCHMHQTECVLLQTHKLLIFLFQALVRRRSLLFNFFGLYLHFFSWVIGNTSSVLGAPLKIAPAFFLPMDYFFGCVLEETHGTTILEARRDC